MRTPIAVQWFARGSEDEGIPGMKAFTSIIQQEEREWIEDMIEM